MRRALFGLVLLAAAAPVLARAPVAPAAEQDGYIAYHECMMVAAMQASRTAARDEEVFALAKARCAPTRAAIVVGQARNAAFLAALDEADATDADDFPEWIHGVRARGETTVR